MKRVEDACAVLRGHFDYVQIFCGIHDAEHNKFSEIDSGVGSWLARYGHVRTWIVVQDEVTRKRVTSE